MKYILILVLTLFMITEYGCSPKFYCNRCPIQSKDSVAYITKDSIIERIDTTYLTDSSSVQMLIKCDSLGNAYLGQLTYLQNNPKVKIEYKIVNGKLSIDCKVDSLEIYNKYKYHFKQDIRYINKIQTIEKEKKVIPFYIWIIIGGLIAIAIYFKLQ